MVVAVSGQGRHVPQRVGQMSDGHDDVLLLWILHKNDR